MGGSGSILELIELKKRGASHSEEQIRWLCSAFVAGEIPDYQMSAWLMAVCWRGLEEAETLALTRAMIASGKTLEWSSGGRTVVDKHSTGGVGDKTSLVLVPLMAAAGFAFVKMSGRGLGHTGGTIDKLEAIPGFVAELPLESIREQVNSIGCALVGQSPQLVPADGKIYALRDATSTVDSVALIASSIMSKKLAAGAPVIVLDVKFGSGAFMQTLEAARELARVMVQIGTGEGRRVRAVLSPMAEPLGSAIGNALEVREAIDTLHGAGPADLRDLTLELGAQLMMLAEPSPGESARARLRDLLDSGAAAEKLVELIEAQGGDGRVVGNPDLLPSAPVTSAVRYDGDAECWVRAVDARGAADAALMVGAGRRVKGEMIDSRTGVVLHARTGDRLAPGDTLAFVHAASEAAAKEAAAQLLESYRFSDTPTPRPTGSYEVIG